MGSVISTISTMTEEEEKIIDEVMEPKLPGKQPEFEGEIYFSTDGKHTVHAKATTPEGRKAGLDWAFKAYERITVRLGTKAQMWEGVINKDKPAEKKDYGNCPDCGAPLAWSFKKKKTYCSEKCWLK